MKTAVRNKRNQVKNRIKLVMNSEKRNVEMKLK